MTKRLLKAYYMLISMPNFWDVNMLRQKCLLLGCLGVQTLSFCLWLRSWSQGPVIKSCVWLLVQQEACFSLCLVLPLLVLSFWQINKSLKKNSCFQEIHSLWNTQSYKQLCIKMIKVIIEEYVMSGVHYRLGPSPISVQPMSQEVRMVFTF